MRRRAAPGRRLQDACLKALRRMINKHVNIKFTSLYSTRMNRKSTRARLDQPVNRIARMLDAATDDSLTYLIKTIDLIKSWA